MTTRHPHLLALRQAQRWCHERADLRFPSQSLRSAVLQPPEYPGAWSYIQLYPAWIEQLIARRAELLATTPHDDAVPPGRILAVLQDADTYMGEGAPVSQGVIDEIYLPPWDTWFAYLPLERSGVLLAWIPSLFEPLVEVARVVAATEPLAWLDDIPTEPLSSCGDGWTGIANQLRYQIELIEGLFGP